MTHKHKLPNNVTINVAPENIYRIKPGFMGRLKWKLRRINAGFLVVFGTDSKKAVSYESPKYSAKVLKTINESRALKTALKEEFKQAVNTKTLFMYFLLIAGAVVVYLFMTGQLSV